ncbi:MAG: four helix bundle protein [Anaerolineaceae bacterium]|nr:four helix bundle protein [Anaerolineaceae bacterium]
MRIEFVYHKLQVWHLAKGLVKNIYSITKRFPPEEKFGLVGQINRAAISIASNIAEGSGRTSRKDQAHFTQLAYGSLMEVACQLEIARDLDFIGEDDLTAVFASIKTIAEKLSALRRSQLAEMNKKTVEG